LAAKYDVPVTRVEPHPYLSGPVPIALAHRGGGNREYENTWRAFTEAVELGYTYIETDAQVTRDGQVVLFHDDDLTRLTGWSRKISELSYVELCQEKIGGSETIPLMVDVLERWPQVKLNVDLKSDAVVAPFAKIITELKAMPRVCIASFSDQRIRRAAGLVGPDTCLSAGKSSVARLLALSRLPSGMLKRFGRQPDVVQVPLKSSGVSIVTERFVNYVHSRGIAIHVWTINDPAEMTAVLDLGVDGVVSDETRQLRSVLQGRGVWPE
jgi:glycerophosphoryl diester phosphodiesterase